MQELTSRLMADEKVKKAIQLMEENAKQTVEEQMVLCAIASPSHHEEARSMRYLEMLEEIGFDETWTDDMHNVFARMKGVGQGPALMLAAHLDTVFSSDVDCTPRIENGIIYAPGIGDDARGLAELLTIARTMKTCGILPVGDILFCGNVCEESRGNMEGTKYIFKTRGDIDAFITVDGLAVNNLDYNAHGNYICRITYHGFGGHTCSGYGTPNPIYAMGRAISRLQKIKVDPDTYTIFNLSMAQSGFTYNAIPTEGSLTVDMRSSYQNLLEELKSNIINICEEAGNEENAFCSHPDPKRQLSVTVDILNHSPAGRQLESDPIVQAGIAAYKAFGIEPKISVASCTDANIPISLGIPALALGRAGTTSFHHSLKEQYDPSEGHLGPQRTLLLALMLIGMEGVCKPVLQKLCR